MSAEVNYPIAYGLFNRLTQFETTSTIGVEGGQQPAYVPALSLDFAGEKALPSTVTFTRLNPTATYYNASGVLTTATTDVPRFDHDPSTLVSKGLLIEEQRTNLLTRSQEFDNVAWARTNILAFGSGSIANAVVSPSGETNADKAVEDTNNGNHTIFQSYTVASGGAYTFSVYLKTAERYRCLLVAGGGFAANQAGFNLNTGETYGVVGCTAAITSVGNGWYRCTWVATANASVATTFGIYFDNGTTPTYTGNGTSGLYLWGAQLEAGAFPTSYIPTTSAQVTRSADVCQMTGANFSSWYNQTEGTFVAKVRSPYETQTAGTQGGVFIASDGTNNNYHALKKESGASTYGVGTLNGGVIQSAFAVLTPSTANQIVSATYAYKVNDFAGTANGGTVTTDTSGSIPTVDRLNIGNSFATGSTWFFNGHIARLTFYPTRLSNAVLQALST
jgi:hypothetical protein